MDITDFDQVFGYTLTTRELLTKICSVDPQRHAGDRLAAQEEQAPIRTDHPAIRSSA